MTIQKRTTFIVLFIICTLLTPCFSHNGQGFSQNGQGFSQNGQGFSRNGQAAVIYVPDAHASIQEAITAAANGDTIIVREGTYVENINFMGKAVTLTSESGASSTVIDGNQTDSCVKFESGEEASSILDGFTLRNALADEGGGIRCSFYTSPTIRNNLIHSNTAGFGAGIFCQFASPEISNNSIYANSAGFGGGLYCLDASPQVTSNSFVGNFAASLGGGIACRDGSSPVIMGNVISMNQADAGAGIMCRNQASPKLINNTISVNTANTGGGILCTENASPEIANNTISENEAVLGGGICCRYNSSPSLSNNTVVFNTATSGGGFYCWQSEPWIMDSIFWKNEAPDGQELALVGGSILHISHSDLMGGQVLVSMEIGSVLDWGAGMIDEDPLFVTGANGLYFLSQIAAGQIQDSPCIDAGSVTVAAAGLDTYWTRTDEVFDAGTVDMGFHYGPFSSAWTAPFYPDIYTISESAGGTIEFTLDAGVSKANRSYLILAGFSGTEPGIFLPSGLPFPLNWDTLTFIVFDLTLTGSPIISNFLGTLDASGQSTASLYVPPVPPGLLGTQLSFAYTLDDPWEYASNPVDIAMVP